MDELAALLEEIIATTDDTDAKIRLLYDEARLRALHLNEVDRAERIWQQVLAIAPEEQGAHLAPRKRSVACRRRRRVR